MFEASKIKGKTLAFCSRPREERADALCQEGERQHAGGGSRFGALVPPSDQA